ncbi:hypothetical protein CMEL01_07542 [Colletotrichum melonis]|uniref:Secreted protein n=2 Tax=Colletotrichum acutatum species complex TaxID=2707335 RepID=A0AAI9YNP6_9PEZI|nr:uncharacterized protein CCOS01_12132 [Colletotrichum costaricense]KAK1450206.1 hypothetical protein CMEL01_07542 [Colletotrichum melonis]KAK1517875.1 hypothetical protein CCOS01_12132 [Colletotrichum costaricense]
MGGLTNSPILLVLVGPLTGPIIPGIIIPPSGSGRFAVHSLLGRPGNPWFQNFPRRWLGGGGERGGDRGSGSFLDLVWPRLFWPVWILQWRWGGGRQKRQRRDGKAWSGIEEVSVRHVVRGGGGLFSCDDGTLACVRGWSRGR